MSWEEEGKATEPSGWIGSGIAREKERKVRVYCSSSTALVIFPASHFVHHVLIRWGGGA